MDNRNQLLQNRLLAEFNDRFDSDNENESNATIILNESNEQPVHIVRIKGFRSGSNLVWVPDEQCIFYQNVENKKLKEISCTCYVKECDARIVIKEDQTAYKLRKMKHKYHGSMYDTYKHMECFNLMKDKCHSAPASISVREIYNETVLEYALPIVIRS